MGLIVEFDAASRVFVARVEVPPAAAGKAFDTAYRVVQARELYETDVATALNADSARIYGWAYSTEKDGQLTFSSTVLLQEVIVMGFKLAYESSGDGDPP